jgi:hypothetical protein
MRITGLTLGLTALVILTQGTANAAAGSETSVPFVNGKSVLPVTFIAGDCRQIGQNQLNLGRGSSEITMQQPNWNGDTILTWHAVEYTKGSFFGDTWHAKFVFKTATGIVTLTATADGLRLGNGSDRDPIQDLVQNIPVHFSTPLWYPLTTQVDWYGDC